MRFSLRLLTTTLVCQGMLGVLPAEAEDSPSAPAQAVVAEEAAVTSVEGSTAQERPEADIPDTATADTGTADTGTADTGTAQTPIPEARTTAADPLSEPLDPADLDVNHPTPLSAGPENPEQIDFADRSRLWVVHRLDTLSGSLDTFFMNMLFDEQLVDQDIRGNTARISASSYRVRHELAEYKLGLGINIVLPNTNERLNLLISSQGEDEGNEPDIIRSAERANYVAALRFIIRESKRWKIDADAGVNWALIPDPYTRIRARRPLEYGFMKFRFTQELNYYTKEGYGEKTDLRFDFLVSEQKLLRFETGASYLLNDEYFKLRYGAGLFNQVSRKFAYVVQAGATGNTEYGPTFDRYIAGIRFRRQIYKDWMFFEVHPQMIWADEYDWNHRPALLLKLEAELAE